MLKIIEVLDYGMSLLENGSVLKADGTIISKEAYEASQEAKVRNRLEWSDIDINEFIDHLNNAIFSTKTYDTEEQSQGMSISKKGFAFIDETGEPYYLRSSEFSGAETYQITQVTWSKFIYNVNRNSSDEAFRAMSDIIENFYKVEEQVGSMFSPDDETHYLTKKFVKDNHVWSMVFRNGSLSNIKQVSKIHKEVEAKPKNSKLSDALTTNKFANMY